MSEKVLHEWGGNRGVRFQIRDDDGMLHCYRRDGRWGTWEEWDIAYCHMEEILRLSAELARVLDVLSESGKEIERYAVRESNMKTPLARARAQGRLEGIERADTACNRSMSLREFRSRLDELLRAESELAGREEDGGEQ